MSPRRKEDNALIRAQRKDEILAISLRLFANRGYEATSISQIAKEAGISKGLIYNYFESKESLLKALVAELSKIDIDFQHQIIDDDPRKMLSSVISLFVQLLTSQKDKMRLISALAFQVDKFDFIQDLATQKMNAYRQLFIELMKKLSIKNPEKEALALGVMLDGIATQYLLINDYPIMEMKEYLIERYCKN